jgi:hypothetical protein
VQNKRELIRKLLAQCILKGGFAAVDLEAVVAQVDKNVDPLYDNSQILAWIQNLEIDRTVHPSVGAMFQAITNNEIPRISEHKNP